MSRRPTLLVNSEVRDIIRTHGIPMHDALGYLVCVYYGLEPSYIPTELERRVLAAGILTQNYESNTIVWVKSLFEETEIGFEWISQWMDLFKRINPERRGTKSYVLTRMKKFFVQNPAVRKEDVFEATNIYLGALTSPMYCKKSHKFIFEQDGSSMLLDYVENLSTTRRRNVNQERDII